MTTTANSTYATDAVIGTGAAINVSLGWVPSRVEVFNVTDGDTFTVSYLEKRIPFTSGGTNEIVAGDLIKGATSLATARVRKVLLISGTWAGGDAAGTLLVNPEDITGTFGTENVYVVGDGGANDASVTVQVQAGYDSDTAVAGVVTDAVCSAYLGSTTASKGFTIGSTISESAKELRWVAQR